MFLLINIYSSDIIPPYVTAVHSFKSYDEAEKEMLEYMRYAYSIYHKEWEDDKKHGYVCREPYIDRDDATCTHFICGHDYKDIWQIYQK